ncbi:MAG: hypothetical protein ACK40Q_04720 [Pseudothermotoga sp.]
MKQSILIIVLVAVVSLIVLVLYSKQTNTAIVNFEDGETNFRIGIERYVKENNLKVQLVTIRVDQRIDEIEKILRRYTNCYAVGPRTSTEALSLLPYLEKYQIFAIAPLVTSPGVIGKSRFLMTLSASDNLQARELVQRLQEDLRKNTIVICDKNNIVYSENLFQMMTQSSSFPLDCLYINSADELLNFDFSQYDSMVLVLDGRVAGLVAQLAVRKGFTGTIYGSDYAYTDALIPTGGLAVEGMIVYNLFDFSQMTKFGFTDLQEAGSYDALMVIWSLISSKIRTDEAYNYLVGKKFTGITGTFTVEPDLSVSRSRNFVLVKNGQFVGDEVAK